MLCCISPGDETVKTLLGSQVLINGIIGNWELCLQLSIFLLTSPLGIPACRMHFFRTASDIEAKLTTALPGDEICIRDEFAPNTPYALVLEVREDGFDPAEADPNFPNEGG